LVDSRRGIRVSRPEIKKLDELISPLLKQGQSLAHIFATHESKINCSRKTIYNYINASAFKARNLDLPRKVRYKRRKMNYAPKIEYRYRIGRTYADFNAYLEEHPGTNVVEMDTLKGKRTKGKVLLTFIFCESSFMLIFLLDAPSQECVIGIFDMLSKILGLRAFKRLFPVILTDNGCEFKDVEALEFTKNGAQRTRLFYCDPQAAWQKPHIEKGHEFIRYVIPKGNPLDCYSQKDMTHLCNHVNSFARDSLFGKCPFEAGKEFLRTKLLESLELERVSPDAVHLNPALLKH
jgi:IS30 family transposase